MAFNESNIINFDHFSGAYIFSDQIIVKYHIIVNNITFEKKYQKTRDRKREVQDLLKKIYRTRIRIPVHGENTFTSSGLSLNNFSIVTRDTWEILNIYFPIRGDRSFTSRFAINPDGNASSTCS